MVLTVGRVEGYRILFIIFCDCLFQIMSTSLPRGLIPVTTLPSKILMDSSRSVIISRPNERYSMPSQALQRVSPKIIMSTLQDY